MSISSSVCSPLDGGGSDLDALTNAVQVTATQATFQIQLTDAVYGVDDTSANNAGNVTLAKNGTVLTQGAGNNYTFSYDSGTDKITLTSNGGNFNVGKYVLNLSGVKNGNNETMVPAEFRVQIGQMKNIILMIGDGMGIGHVSMGNVAVTGGMEFEDASKFPFTASVQTRSASYPTTTDSAAAATAMATGVEVLNEKVSHNGTNPITTSLEQYADAGKRTGLVTTTEIADATPACFGAHNTNRGNHTQIIEAATAGFLSQSPLINVLLGGGHDILGAGDSTRKTAITTAGYELVETETAMNALDPDSETLVWGAFKNGNMPYMHYGMEDYPELSEMTSFALDLVEHDADGFFLMVEGGLIDKASHLDTRDKEAMKDEVVEFDDTVAVVYDWVQTNAPTETLIIVTTDHDTGHIHFTGPNWDDFTWNANNHSPDDVRLYATGPGAECVGGTYANEYVYTLTRPDTTAPTSDLTTPDDQGTFDKNPAVGKVLVHSSQSSFVLQLADAGRGIDDYTVDSAAVTVTKNGTTLVAGTDYNFNYDGTTDRITLTKIGGGNFGHGCYQITLNGGNSRISDRAVPANPLAQVTWQVVIWENISNQLFIHGTPDAETITISASGGKVLINGTQPFSPTVNTSAVTQLSVWGWGGGDTLSLSGVNTTNGYQQALDGDVSIYGGAGNDSITGSLFADAIFGEAGDDTIYGGAGNDTIDGGDNNDRLFGQAGDDSIVGGAGNDTYSFWGSTNLGDDTVAEASGIDTLDFSQFTPAVDIDLSDAAKQPVASGYLFLTLPSGSSMENVVGTSANDTIQANGQANSLDGGAGNDTYRFWGSTDLGDDTIADVSGTETLDFSQLNHYIDLSLADAAKQTVASGYLLLTLPNGSSIENVVGTASYDLIVGNALNNVIYAGAGADEVEGGDGNDLIYGGADSDELEDYGGGDDTIYGEEGNDAIRGEAGNDRIEGGDGDDHQLIGGTGDDTILGGAGNDYILGEDGNDVLYGEGGDESIFGGAGNDLIDGGADSDSLQGDDGDDTLYGQAGIDLLIGDSIMDGSAGDDVLYGGAEYDAIYGCAGDDTIYGGEGGDYIFGDGYYLDIGNDWIFGEAGDDTLLPGLGDDTLEGGAGEDVYYFPGGAASGGDVIVEYSGGGSDLLSFAGFNSPIDIDLSDTNPQTVAPGLVLTLNSADTFDNVIGSSQADTIRGNSNSNVLDGNGGNGDLIYGSDGDDVIYGTSGDDTIEGGAGNDRIEGGAGNDVYVFSGGDSDLGDDTLVESSGNGTDRIDFSGMTRAVTIDLGDATNLQNVATGNLHVRLTDASGIEQVKGSAYNDRITGNSLDNTIWGGDGADTILGGAGNDSLLGEAGADSLLGEAGDDTLVGGTGDDTLRGGANNDVLVFSNSPGQDLGADKITETAADGGTDLLHFGGLSGAVTINLGSTSLQHVTASHLDVTLSDASAIEDVVGSANADNITGNGLNNRIWGGDGADTIYGGAGADTIEGEAGADRLYGDNNSPYGGSSGNDSILGGDGADTCYGDGGNDTIYGDDVADSFTNADLLYGDWGYQNDSYASSYAGSDSLVGGKGNDSLYGEYKGDTLSGGDGADLLYGDYGSYASYAYAGSDSILGGAGDDTIYGCYGHDTILGGADKDLIYGDYSYWSYGAPYGNDSIDAGDGDDTVYGGYGADTIMGGAGADLVFANDGSGDDSVNGGDGDDTLYHDATDTYLNFEHH